MRSVRPERHLLRAKDFATLRYAESIGVGDMAEVAGMSRSHFSRSFTITFGQTPQQFLRLQRLERAALLLRRTDHSVADICMQVGLTSVGSFTSSFRDAFGQTPTQFRASGPPASTWAMIPSCMLPSMRPSS